MNFFDYGMSAVFYSQKGSFINGRTAIIQLVGNFSQRINCIEITDGCRREQNFLPRSSDFKTDLSKKIIFEFGDSFLCVNHQRFIFF